MSRARSVGVVVPVHRNARTLRELHRRLDAALGDHLEHLVLVDDGCPEGSGAVIDDLAQVDPRVRHVRLVRNVGQHAAVLVGLRETSGDWVVVLDADLQDPPEAVPRLLERADGGDVAAVFGGRRGAYEARSRLLMSRAYKRLQGWLVSLPSDAGTFVALRRDVVDDLVALRGPAPSLVAMIGCLGRPVASVPVERARRPEGSSSYSHGARALSAWRALRWVLWWRLGGASR